MGTPLAVHPHEAILECIRIASGEVAYCSEQIAKLEAGHEVGPVVTRHVRPLKEEKGAESAVETVEETTYESPALDIWVKVRQEAMDRLVRYSAAALKANVEERRVQLAERTGAMIAQVLKGVLADLGLNDRPELPGLVRRHLALVAGNAA